MPIYYGSSRDGSDIKEFEGFYTSENGEFWGTMPIDNNGVFIKKSKHCSKFHK